jgi:hypothetical protein
MDSKQFYTDYYASLKGARITKVELIPDEEWPDHFWPTFTVKTKAIRKTKTRDAVPAQTLTIEVSQDEEGNGPGFLFGLPNPKQPEQVITDIAEVDPRLDEKRAAAQRVNTGNDPDCLLCVKKLTHGVHFYNQEGENNREARLAYVEKYGSKK